MIRRLAPLWGALLLFGCPLDFGGGGGGGDGTIDFTRGFVFVRRDDRNVRIADSSDLSTVARLTSAGNARHPSLSRDGRRVVFVQSELGETSLQVVASSGASPPSVVLRATATERNFRNPVFSPDGTRIAFAYDSGSASAIGLVNSDGSGFTRLAGGGTLSYGSPSFFADGQSLLAAAGNSSSNLTQLERISLSGARTPVTNDLDSEATQIVNRVVVSPDGARAAFDARLAQNPSATRIFVIDLGTTQVTQLTDYSGDSDRNAQDGFPTWMSSDRVAYSSDAGGADQVYALPVSALKTSGPLQLPSAIEPWFGP